MHQPQQQWGAPGQMPRENVAPLRPPHQYQPHYHEAVFVNTPPPPVKETSVNKITVPLIMTLSGAVFLMGITYAATSQFSDIKHAIEKLSGRIETLTGELASRIGRLEQTDADRQRERWSKTDHDLWCARTEQVNSGWRCADAGEPLRRYGPPPAVTPQWQTGTKK